jgi:hypothetical protein
MKRGRRSANSKPTVTQTSGSGWYVVKVDTKHTGHRRMGARLTHVTQKERQQLHALEERAGSNIRQSTLLTSATRRAIANLRGKFVAKNRAGFNLDSAISTLER